MRLAVRITAIRQRFFSVIQAFPSPRQGVMRRAIAFKIRCSISSGRPMRRFA